MATITGNGQKNRLVGTNGADLISGLGGNDTLIGKNGDDILKGGSGNDQLFGGNGDDKLLGEAGNDRLVGGNGDDKAVGGAGNDRLEGGKGSDILEGGAGNDLLKGGDGPDILRGGAGRDTADFSDATKAVAVFFDDAGGGLSFDFSAVAASDILTSVENVIGTKFDDAIQGPRLANIANVLDGGAGNDTLQGGAGNDTLKGGTGDDELQGDDGADALIGGAGIDTARYASNSGVTVNLANPALNAGLEAIGDTYNGIENVLTSNGDDTLVGDGAANTLDGDDGRDVFTGGGGNDVFKFTGLNDSGIGAANADFILDFTQGADKIDISSIAGGGFQFLGENQPFTLAGNELTFTTIVELVGLIPFTRTLISADTDDDANAEFEIKLAGDINLTAADFIV